MQIVCIEYVLSSLEINIDSVDLTKNKTTRYVINTNSCIEQSITNSEIIMNSGVTSVNIRNQQN